MAWAADTVCEFRASGSNNNSGTFADSLKGATGVDYTQQDAAQWTNTNLVYSGTGNDVTVTTVNDNTCLGNYIYIRSGTNLTVGWYPISAWADAGGGNYTLTLDRAPGTGASSNGTYNVGGARAVPTDAYFEAMVSGNKVWFKYGTYTYTETISIGASVSDMLYAGYYTTRGDEPQGNNRPTLAIGSNTHSWGTNNAWSFIKNFICTGTGGNVFNVRGISQCHNCKITNTSSTADRQAGGADSGSYLYCDLSSTNGHAFSGASGSTNRVIYCHLHDSKNGTSPVGTNNRLEIVGTIISKCTVAVQYGTTSTTVFVYGCTISGCTTGFSLGDGYAFAAINTIISGCTTGYTANAVSPRPFFFNCQWNNTTDITNGPDKSAWCQTGDPLFVDPTNLDVSLQSGSPCIGAGPDMAALGAIADYKINIGVDQDNNAAGGNTYVNWYAGE